MKKVIILQGIPGSGKTTWARDFLLTHPDYIRISRDDIRNMRGKYWIPKQENYISDIENYCLLQALSYRYNIILDNTNLNHKTLDNIKSIVEKYNKDYVIIYKLFNPSVDVCIERDSKRPNSVGEEVIRGFYNRYKDDILN